MSKKLKPRILLPGQKAVLIHRFKTGLMEGFEFEMPATKSVLQFRPIARDRWGEMQIRIIGMQPLQITIACAAWKDRREDGDLKNPSHFLIKTYNYNSWYGGTD